MTSPLMITANTLTAALALSVSLRTIVRLESADPIATLDQVRDFPSATMFSVESNRFAGGEVVDVFGRLNSGSFRLFIVKAPDAV